MNDERHDKDQDSEIMVYGSLIFAGGIMALTIYSAIGYFFGDTYGFIFFAPVAILALIIIFFIQMACLPGCSPLTRLHLLIWYLCLIAVIVFPEPISTVSHEQAKLVLVLGAFVLFILPVIWLCIWLGKSSKAPKEAKARDGPMSTITKIVIGIFSMLFILAVLLLVISVLSN